jgi:hypothetical protein
MVFHGFDYHNSSDMFYCDLLAFLTAEAPRTRRVNKKSLQMFNSIGWFQEIFSCFFLSYFV